MNDDEMDGECVAFGGGKKYIQSFDGKLWTIVTSWKALLVPLDVGNFCTI
jgi:hypothetical protein